MKRLHSIFIAFFALIISITGSGCGTRIDTSVNTFAAPDALQKRTFALLPGISSINKDDIEYKEYARLVERTLVAEGFRPTDPRIAELAIFITYAIGEPRTEQYTYEVPTYGTAITGSTTTGNVYTSTYGNQAYSTLNTNTQYQTKQVVTGSTMQTASRTMYDRTLILEAIDMQEKSLNSKIIQIWKTKTYSTGSISDLRPIIPAMLIATKPYIGKNSNTIITSRIKLKDNRIEVLTSEKQLEVTPGTTLREKKVP